MILEGETYSVFWLKQIWMLAFQTTKDFLMKKFSLVRVVHPTDADRYQEKGTNITITEVPTFLIAGHETTRYILSLP